MPPLYRAICLATLLFTALSSEAGKATLTPIDGRPPAPEFTLADPLGNQVRLSDFRGQVLVVNFWASWCPPCLEEMPSMERGAAWLSRFNGRFIAINLGEKPAVVKIFLEQTPLSIEVLLDPDAATAALWGVEGLPISFVLDRDGRIVYRARGARDWSNPALLVPVRALGLSK